MKKTHLTFAAAATNAIEALGRAEQAATDNPAAAISVALDAIRATEAAHIPCLISRAYATLGVCRAQTGDIGDSSAAFASALASSCAWCLPNVERLRCYLIQVTEGPHKALAIAREALRGAISLEVVEVDLFRHTLGVMLHYSGFVPEAVREISAVVENLSSISPYYPAVVQSLYLVMLDSNEPEDLRYANEKLSESEEKQKGVKHKTAERAKLSWVRGGGLVKLAVLDESLLDGARQEMLQDGARVLRKAVDSLELLHLPLEIAACRTDLAAALALVNPSGLSYALRMKVRDLPTGVAMALSKASKAAGATLTPESLADLWESLRRLRDSTVAAGAPLPLVCYAFD